jgi:hypothetical protein
LCSSQRRKESYQERERNGLEAAMTGYLTPDSNLQEALLLKKKGTRYIKLWKAE